MRFLALLLVLLAGESASAKPRSSNYQRHEAVCLRGEIAVCAQPVSRHQDVAIRTYRTAGRSTWRVVFDTSSGMSEISQPICSCARRISSGALTLTCTCTGR